MNDFIVIDNVLLESDFLAIKKLIYFNDYFPFFLHKDVTFDSIHGEYWSWYGAHVLYDKNIPNSEYFKNIFELFLPIFKKEFDFKSLLRIKINFYPHTEKIQEHQSHSDYEYSHKSAIFSLNTCDGFTRIGDTKVDSVENRLLIFDGSVLHNSSTTTTDCGRFNINFNWI